MRFYQLCYGAALLLLAIPLAMFTEGWFFHQATLVHTSKLCVYGAGWAAAFGVLAEGADLMDPRPRSAVEHEVTRWMTAKILMVIFSAIGAYLVFGGQTMATVMDREWLSTSTLCLAAVVLLADWVIVRRLIGRPLLAL